MQNNLEKQCLFCSDSIPYRYGDLRNIETHLKISHDIKDNKGFSLYIVFLSQEERAELQFRLEPRMKELRMDNEEITELRDERED